MHLKILEKTKDAEDTDMTVLSKTSSEMQRLWETIKRVPGRQPKAADEGLHPEWPGYTGIGTKLDFKLDIQGYKSDVLVENTVMSFFPALNDRNLTPTQISARAKIIYQYNQAKCSKKPLTTRDMNKFLSLFDQFFFAGAMVNNGRPRAYCKLWHKESPNVQRFAPEILEDRMPWGYTGDRYIRGYGQVAEIHIPGASFFDHPEQITAAFFLETLVHEMVHAYVNIFMCRCKACDQDMVNTRGLTGHGKTFIMLLDCIDYTLRAWDIGLSGLMRQWVCHEGKQHLFDEVRTLHQIEMAYYNRVSRPIIEETPSRTEETLNAKRTGMIKEEADTPGMVWVQVNGPRPLEYSNPGMNVYMTAPQVGGTMVDLWKLNETGDIVQALIADEAAKPTKNKAKYIFKYWQK
ncbi:hypothetical protein E0Z10_g4401 [Xylaria hypoxylon]|uniref:SprT-like domain-containing protein n=1 Tax=Xylaria hypoxylon TaxID=37992 RepID=A0A4Z0Z701_9PEZI|nr:hypothetical protein E0Z10_g4401 [Xylaria hypoxylon]